MKRLNRLTKTSAMMAQKCDDSYQRWGHECPESEREWYQTSSLFN
jgi:hypothetical protein